MYKSKTDHLFFIADLQLFGESCEQLDSLIHIVQTFRWDMGDKEVWCACVEKGESSELRWGRDTS